MWERKLYFYPSAGGFEKTNKHAAGVLGLCVYSAAVIVAPTMLPTMRMAVFACVP